MDEEQKLLRFRAADGFLVSGLLTTSGSENREAMLKTPVLLQIHGLLGHFLARGTPRLLPQALLDRGFNSLSINTRLASGGQIIGQGIFDDTIHDLDASVELLVEEGFENIFVHGYSLGASMVLYWAANREDSPAKGLALEGAAFSLPDSRKKRWARYGSSPTYNEVYEQAKALLGIDPRKASNDEVFAVYQSAGPSRQPTDSEIYTYKTWWFMLGPEAHNAMSHRQIAKVQVPMLLMRGEHDELVEEWEPEALAKIARDAGKVSVRVRQIRGAGHDCMENADEMLGELVGMMSGPTGSS